MQIPHHTRHSSRRMSWNSIKVFGIGIGLFLLITIVLFARLSNDEQKEKNGTAGVVTTATINANDINQNTGNVMGNHNYNKVQLYNITVVGNGNKHFPTLAPVTDGVDYCNSGNSYLKLVNNLRQSERAEYMADAELLSCHILTRHGTRLAADAHEDSWNCFSEIANRKATLDATGQIQMDSSNHYLRSPFSSRKLLGEGPCLEASGAQTIINTALALLDYLEWRDFDFTLNDSLFISTNYERTKTTTAIYMSTLARRRDKHLYGEMAVMDEDNDVFRPFESPCDFGSFLKWEKNALNHENYDNYYNLNTKEKEIIDLIEGLMMNSDGSGAGKDNGGWLHKFQKKYLIPFCNNERFDFGIPEASKIFSKQQAGMFQTEQAFRESKKITIESVKFLFNEMQSTINNENDNKLTVIGTHDFYLAYLLSSLEIDDFAWPKFASFVLLELYRKPNNEYFVRISQDGKELKMVPFDKFEQLTRFRNNVFSCPPWAD